MAMHHEPYARFPEPDGADGGAGGAVIFQADEVRMRAKGKSIEIRVDVI